MEEGPHRELLGVEAAPGGHLAGAQVGQEARDLDLDRADLAARPAQGRRVWQRAAHSRCPASCGVRIAPIGPGIDRSVRVPAHPRVHRAHVQARRAADAAERLAPDLVGERLHAAVVEQDEVELARAVAARRTHRSTPTCTGSAARRSRSAAGAGGRPPCRASSGSPSRSPSPSRAPRGASCTSARCPRTRRRRRCRSPPPRSSRRSRPCAPTGTSRAGAAAPPRSAPPARR